MTDTAPTARFVDSTGKTALGAPAPLIAHIIFRLDFGGLENGLVNLINRIPDERYRHAVICLSDYTEFHRRLRPGVSVHALHKRSGKDLPMYGRLWRVLRELRPAIVHTRNLGTLDSQVMALLAGVRGRIHGEHGYDVHDMDGSNVKYQRLRRVLSPLVQRFVPLSRDLEDYLVQRVGVPARKITRICNGVDVERFRPLAGGGDEAAGTSRSRRRATPWPGASADDIVIGCVGRMEVVKDPLNLAHAFLQLRERLPAFRERLKLVHIGGGRLLEETRRVLADGGAGDAAWLPGARDDVAGLLQSFDLFVLPSRAEGISNTILEAMASGVPVVATDVGGNAELVQHGETGAIVPPAAPAALADAIAAYVIDPERRHKHGAAARLRAEQAFSIDTMVASYLAVYDAVCHHHAHA